MKPNYQKILFMKWTPTKLNWNYTRINKNEYVRMSAAHSWILMYSYSLRKRASEMAVILCVQRYSSSFPLLPSVSAALFVSLIIYFHCSRRPSFRRNYHNRAQHYMDWTVSFSRHKSSPYWKIIFISWENLWEVMDSADNVHTDFYRCSDLSCCHVWQLLGTLCPERQWFSYAAPTG
jgi:hypothetical protein